VKMSLVNQGRVQSAAVGAPLTLGFEPHAAVALPAGELSAEE